MSLTAKYQLAFDISPVPMLLVSNDGEILLANADFLDLFEYENDELIGMSVEALVPEQIRAHHPELRNAYQRVPTKRSMGGGRDLHGVTKNGTIIPLELGLEPVSHQGTNMALVAAIDIRHRKLHEDRMHRAMDAAASAMVMVDGNSEIVFVNKAASALFGYEESELLGSPVEKLVPEEFRRAHPVYTESYLSDSRERPMGLGRDLYARRHDGSQVPVEITLTPVETPTGQMVMSTIIDLSERVSSAREVARKNAELAGLNVELSHFVYSASHDLKAPLSSITGLLELCVEDIQDGALDVALKNLAKVKEISRRSALKVEGVMQIARAGDEQIPLQAVVLGPIIKEIWLDLTGEQSRTELSLDLKYNDPFSTEAPTLKLIIENLVSNALRYADQTKPQHTIKIASKIIDGGIMVAISDNGIGISEQNQPKVFQMFKRLDDRSGDGLGLTLVRKQVERLGGTITLTSTEGSGAEFTFWLPIEDKKNG